MANIKKQELKKYHIIYKTTNKITGKIYIGAHSTDILNDGYLGSGHNLVLSIEKHGKLAFERTILYSFDTPQEMFAKEKEIVNADFLKRNDVYNIVEGGFGGTNRGTTGLKHISNPYTGKRCAVHPNAIPKMLKEGWIIGRNMSSTTNTIWIHKNDQKKMIHPTQLLDYVNQGWHKGLPNSPTSNKIWIYNKMTDEYSLCSKEDLETKFLQGWIKKKWAPVKKGAVWVNNELNNLRIDKNELDSYLSNGWKRGMITSRWD
jgi:hypothetical protein